MTTLRILMVTFGYYPAVGWGGPVKVVHQNTGELRRRGHEIRIATSNLWDKRTRMRGHSYQDVVDGIEVSYLHTQNLPFWPGTLGPTRLATHGRRVLEELVAWADVVHVNGVRNALAMTAMNMALAQGKPVVLQPHGTLQYIENSIFLKRAFDALSLRKKLARIDAFIALQGEEARQVIAAGAPPATVHIVANGVNPAELSSPGLPDGFLRERYGISSEAKLILFLGRINHKKGVDLLVKAFAEMVDKVSEETFLIIAGPDDGQLGEALALVADNDLRDQVFFPGLLRGDEVSLAYADADLFALPCRTDTFPMTLIEACAAGVPIVLTETCEIAGLLDGKAAKVVPLNVASIADGMKTVLADHALQQHYRQGGAALLDQVFAIDKVVDKLEDIYIQVVKGKQSDPTR